MKEAVATLRLDGVILWSVFDTKLGSMDLSAWHGTWVPSLLALSKIFDKLKRGTIIDHFPGVPGGLAFPSIVLNPVPGSMVLSFFFFSDGGGIGVCALRALYPILRQALGYCQALIKYQEPSIWPCLSSETAARQSRLWPHMPHYSQSGRGVRGKRAACLHKTDTKGLLFRSPITCKPKATLACAFYFSLWPSPYSHRPRSQALTLDSEMQWRLGDHQGHFAL